MKKDTLFVIGLFAAVYFLNKNKPAGTSAAAEAAALQTVGIPGTQPHYWMCSDGVNQVTDPTDCANGGAGATFLS